MEKVYMLLIAIIAIGFNNNAATSSTKVPVRLTGVQVDHSEMSLIADLVVDGSELQLKSNEELLIEPELDFGDGRTIPLKSVVFAGRNRKIQAERNYGQYNDYIISEAGREVNVSTIVPFESWMKDGNAHAVVTRRGCCKKESYEGTIQSEPFKFAEPWKFKPQFRFVTPKAEGRKIRNLSGKAYIDYRVNRTEIDPGYRNNPRELSVIYSTIDSVKSDADVELKSMTFIGYASPEGSYTNNERLARQRAASLSEYVRKLYSFPDSLVRSSYIAEDWDGLEEAVEQGIYADKEGILAIIRDKSMDADKREHKLASAYPVQYKALRENVYPGLRHSDYTIEYSVKSYDDPVKILEIIETSPQKLSLREMFVAASVLEPGSERYCRVFETAARMFPDSEIANLNAAISELQGGRPERAEYFMRRAGASPEAIYTKGLIAAYKEDYQKAKELFVTASGLGIKEAKDALEQIQEIEK